MAVRVARGTVLQEVRPAGSWSPNRRFHERKSGGATEERLGGQIGLACLVMPIPKPT